MRTITFPLSPPPASSPSALVLTRLAIARWRGSAAAARLPKETARVSTQARYLTQTQDDLKAWIAAGGFSLETDQLSTASAPRPAVPAGLASAECRALTA